MDVASMMFPARCRDWNHIHVLSEGMAPEDNVKFPKGDLRTMQKYKDPYITDEFEGWDGDKVYELDDGSKSELVSYTNSYSYSCRPKAIVWRDGIRCYLEVANMSDKQEGREVW